MHSSWEEHLAKQCKHFFIKISIHLKSRVTEWEREKRRDGYLPFASSFSKFLSQLELVLAQAGNQKLLLGPPHGQQQSRYFRHHLLPLKEPDSEAEKLILEPALGIPGGSLTCCATRLLHVLLPVCLTCFLFLPPLLLVLCFGCWLSHIIFPLTLEI